MIMVMPCHASSFTIEKAKKDGHFKHYFLAIPRMSLESASEKTFVSAHVPWGLYTVTKMLVVLLTFKHLLRFYAVV